MDRYNRSSANTTRKDCCTFREQANCAEDLDKVKGAIRTRSSLASNNLRSRPRYELERRLNRRDDIRKECTAKGAELEGVVLWWSGKEESQASIDRISI